MIDGVKIKVGGKEYVLPPLNWKGHKRFHRAIISGTVHEDAEQLSAMLHAALSRNYPDLTLDDLEEAILPGEMFAAITPLMELSGYMLVAPGEAKRGSVKNRPGTK